MVYKEEIKLIGGELCLDFVNTIHNRNKQASADYIGNGYTSLLSWASLTGVYPKETLDLLTAKAASQPDEAMAAYQRAIELRKVLFTVFLALADGKMPADASIQVFNQLLSVAYRHKVVTSGIDGFSSSWNVSGYPPELLLWPIIESAYLLLTNRPGLKIKKCPSCFWLFADKSKAGRRVWCSMDTCGAADKAKHYYHRKKDRTELET